MENLTKVRGLTSNSISPGRKKVKLILTINDRIKKLVFILTNILYFLNSPSNLVNLEFPNYARIYYYNKDQILYNIETQKTLAFAK